MAIVTSRELTIVLLCLKKALVLKHCRNCATRRCFALTIVFCVLSTGTADAHGILAPDSRNLSKDMYHLHSTNT